MKFLIIGASGFIGRHILRQAVAAGHQAVGTQSGSRQSSLITFDLLHQRIGDCLPSSFLKDDGPVFGVICAALSQIDRCLRERALSYAINVTNTTRLIEDFRKLGIKTVFMSTGSVYDGKVGYYNEEPSHCPINEYGRHKAAIETYIREQVPEAFVTRLDKVVGDDPRENHPFTEWHQAMTQGRPIVCIEGQLFAPTHVDDVAKAIVLGCERGLQGVYNVANPEFFTRDELARQFVLAMGQKTEVVCKSQNEFSFADPRGLKSYLDSTKFIKATGMRFTSMRETMQNFIQKITAS